jgi:hypothetical protein
MVVIPKELKLSIVSKYIYLPQDDYSLNSAFVIVSGLKYEAINFSVYYVPYSYKEVVLNGM